MQPCKFTKDTILNFYVFHNNSFTGLKETIVSSQPKLARLFAVIISIQPSIKVKNEVIEEPLKDFLHPEIFFLSFILVTFFFSLIASRL